MDPVVPPQDNVAYYEAVAKTMSVDALTALEQWVEKVVAPATLLASHSTSGKVDRNRPLCPSASGSLQGHWEHR